MHQGKRVLNWRGPEHRFAWRSLRLAATQSTCQPPAAKPRRVGSRRSDSRRSDQTLRIVRGRTAHIGLRANDFVGSTDRPMNNAKEPETGSKGPKQAAWSYSAARRGGARCCLDSPCQYCAPRSVRQRPPSSSFLVKESSCLGTYNRRERPGRYRHHGQANTRELHRRPPVGVPSRIARAWAQMPRSRSDTISSS